MERVRTVFLMVSVAALLSACASRAPVPELTYDDALLDGTAAFGYTVPAAEPIDVLALSPEMEEFLTPEMREGKLTYSRFYRLMKGLSKGDYFNNNYRVDGTFSAAETFAARKGNCLGYTNMLIALAREAGIDAEYQLVESNPVWNVQAGYLVRSNHINVLIKGLSRPGMGDTEITVDFNLVGPDPAMSTARIISDAHALSLFHANIAVDEMHAGNFERAFAETKTAALLAPHNNVVWNNLAVLYSRMGKPEVAEQVYRVALQLNPDDMTAWAGLVVVLHAQGRQDEAKQYEARVAKYQQNNPVFHYAMAQDAFSTSNYDAAMNSIDNAIALDRKDPRFHTLRAATAKELGDEQLVALSLKRAAKYAKQKERAQGMSRAQRTARSGTQILGQTQTPIRF